jgi:arsenate reductase
MKQVLFVCGHNAGRSQMAEALLNRMAAEGSVDVRATSAGTNPSDAVSPAVVAAMAEVDISLSGRKPKMLTEELADEADRIITMGCGAIADYCPARRYVCEDWHLDDPDGQPAERVRAIRDEIRAKVEALLAEWR